MSEIDVVRLLSKEENEDFQAVFHEIVQDVTELAEYRDMPETNRWMRKVLEYNVPHGKMNRGLSTVVAYRLMTNDLDPVNIHLSHVLGWTVEFLQAFFLMLDDIMDSSVTRRGRPCWYKLAEVGGVSAINDGVLVECCIYMILRKYFQDKDYYVELLDVMHDVTHKTIYGQSLDTRTGVNKNLETFTMERYNGIVKYKTSYYSFYLPIRLAMVMAGINDKQLIEQVSKVTLEMGHFFQVQDDFLDCYGDVEVTGKIGTDIEDCKCSWLFVTALDKLIGEERDILLENYGQGELSKVNRVREIYSDLKLREIYEDYEQQTFRNISAQIQHMSPHLPKILFTGMLAKIYQRSS